MKVLVVGNSNSRAEFKSKFGVKHPGVFKSCDQLKIEDVQSAEIIFDFQITRQSIHGKLYGENQEAILLLNSVKTTLSELTAIYNWKNTIIGFNGFSGMFNRPLLELTITKASKSKVPEIFSLMSTDYRIVEDKVGMVSPRVVCMIINEAFYTVEDGTALEPDIDLAMKLGTNYPEGPFEMAKSIGIRDVYELLQALGDTTGEKRYQVCPLLEQQYRKLN